MAAIEECHGLSTGDSIGGAERVRSGARGNAVLDGPQHGVIVIGAGLNIRERVAAGRRLRRTGRAPEEGHGLRTGTGVIGAERIRAGARSDTLLHGPEDSIVVVRSRLDVFERIRGSRGLRRAGGAPEERHDLRTGTRVIGAERRGAGPGGHSVLNRPQHSIVIVGAGGYIGKGIRSGGLGGLCSADVGNCPRQNRAVRAFPVYFQGSLGVQVSPIQLAGDLRNSGCLRRGRTGQGDFLVALVQR